MYNPLQEKVVIDSIISVQHLCVQRQNNALFLYSKLWDIRNLGVKYANYKFKYYNIIIHALPG